MCDWYPVFTFDCHHIVDWYPVVGCRIHELVNVVVSLKFCSNVELFFSGEAAGLLRDANIEYISQNELIMLVSHHVFVLVCFVSGVLPAFASSISLTRSRYF